MFFRKFLIVVLLSSLVSSCSFAVDGAKTFYVKDFGATGDGKADDGPAIIATFAAAKKCSGTATVVFEKKTYKLGDNPRSWHHFVINDFADLVIEGSGATLLCAKANLGFHFNGGRNITVRGLVFDSAEPEYTQGQVIAINSSGYFDIRIMDGYPDPPDEAFMKANQHHGHGGGGRHMIVFEKDGKSRNTTMLNDHLYISNIKKISDDVFRFFVKEDYMPTFKGVAVGNWVSYGFNMVNLPRSVVDTKHKSASIYAQIAADRVENITLENIDIYSSLNGGIRVSDMHGDVIVRNVNIIRKPGSRNLISIPSDAFHLMNIRGQLIVEDCTIEAPGDDCLNIGTLVENLIGVSKTDKKSVTLRTTDNIYYYYTIRKGDRLQFYNSRSKTILGVATVVKVDFDLPSRIHQVTLDREIDGLDIDTTMVMNLEQMTRQTTLRNNTMKPYMRNAMLVRAQNMTIQGNRLDCSNGGVLAVLAYFSMGEKAQLRNINIKDNTLWCPNRGIVLHGELTDADGVYDARNIEVTDNVFEISPAGAISVTEVKGVTIRGNTFKKNGKLVKNSSKFLKLRDCIDVVVEQ